MTLLLDQTVIPPLPTRQQVREILGLSYDEVRRLDDLGAIVRVPQWVNPVRYYGWSVRDFAEGKPPRPGASR